MAYSESKTAPRKGKKKPCTGCAKEKPCKKCEHKEAEEKEEEEEDKDDALSVHDYLDACELGIQHRSRTYIRARLDATGKKCGGSSIAANKKCNKGTATAAKGSNLRKGLAVAGLLAGAGAVAYGASRVQANNQAAKGVLKKIKRVKAMGNDRLVAAVKSAKAHPKALDPSLQKAHDYHRMEMIKEGMRARQMGRKAAKEGIQSLKASVLPSKARLRKAMKRR